jgi:hypothetical protein
VITEEYIPTYSDQGFQPVIVHTGDKLIFGCDLSNEHGQYMPLLLDSDDTLLNIFQQVGPETVLFPLSFLVDGSNVVQHVYNDKESESPDAVSPPTFIEDLEALLSESDE